MFIGLDPDLRSDFTLAAMNKARKDRTLGAAECARHTGLTVRALRVYERYGLIVPPRSSRGWRRYGPKELIRLNTIMALKDLGMTLGQIRESLTSKARLPLEQVLRMQLQAWRERKILADRAVHRIEAAVAKLQDRELSIDDLCALLRSSETHDMSSIVRESLESIFTAKELRMWRARSAQVPPAEAAESRELFRLARNLAVEYRTLMEGGTDPGSATAQRLLERHNQLNLQFRSREKFLALARWNPALARKIFAYGNRLLARTSASDASRAGDQLYDYMLAVRNASRWWAALHKLHALAKGLRVRKAQLSSSVTEELARRFLRVCRTYGLGNPATFARFQGEFGMSKQGAKLAHYDVATRGGWIYLADAAQQLTATNEAT